MWVPGGDGTGLRTGVPDNRNRWSVTNHGASTEQGLRAGAERPLGGGRQVPEAWGPSSLQPCRRSSPCCCHISPPAPRSPAVGVAIPTPSEQGFPGGRSLISQRPGCWAVRVCACSPCFRNLKLQGPHDSLNAARENNSSWGGGAGSRGRDV